MIVLITYPFEEHFVSKSNIFYPEKYNIITYEVTYMWKHGNYKAGQ